MILLINQLAIPVFQDIANALASVKSSVALFTGKIEQSHRPLSAEVEIVKSISYCRRSLLSRFLSWLLFSVHLTVYLFFKRNISHILVVTNPPIAPFVVRWIAGLKGIPFTLLVYDLYPDALLSAGLVAENSWIYLKWQCGNREILKSAKEIVTLSESMKAAMSRYLDDPDRIIVIPNWVETSYIRPLNKATNPFVVANGLLDKMVVLYSGNMGLTHDLESLMDAAAALRENQHIVFVLIGEGAKVEKLKSRKEVEKLDNVIFLPYQSALEFPFAMAAGDIGVVTLGLGSEGVSVPSKTYINMAAGLCLLCIAPSNSELHHLVEKYACGKAIDPQKPDRIVDFLVEMYSVPDMLLEYKERARLASMNFRTENAVRYIELLATR